MPITNITDSGLPSVTVIFLTYNGMSLVENVLIALRNQCFPGAVEILCIDSMSSDGTFDVAKRFCDRIIQIRPEDFHHARTRNLGVSLASHEICVFLSQDAMPVGLDWLNRLVEPFLDPEVGAVYGRQEAPPTFGPQRRYSLSEVYPATRQIRKIVPGKKRSLQDLRFSNANGAIRRKMLLEYPFPEFVLHSEDMAACSRILELGKVVIYEPQACVIHGHERSIAQEFGWAFDAGVSLKRLGILGNPEFGSEMGYGIKKMVGEILHFARRGAIGTTFVSFSVYVARWMGVQLGKREKSLPTWLIRQLSPTLHREHSRTVSQS